MTETGRQNLNGTSFKVAQAKIEFRQGLNTQAGQSSGFAILTIPELCVKSGRFCSEIGVQSRISARRLCVDSRL